MRTKEKAAGLSPKAATSKKPIDNYTSELAEGNSAQAQRRRILTALRKGPLTTIQARKHLDVLHPGARVMELRDEGYEIITQRCVEYTAANKPHRVAKYVLLPGSYKRATK